VSKIPDIPDHQLRMLWGRIRPVVKAPDGRFWYIKEDDIDLRRTVFNRDPQLSVPAGRLELLMIIPVATTLLWQAKSPEPTVAEIFEQLMRPILLEAPSIRERIGRIGAFWVDQEEFTIDQEHDRMIIYVSLFKGRIPQ
jgi:hypothetical protein